jgi:pentatricopeptide repeat protein
MEKAVEILDEMALAGVSPDEHTYTTIMNGYAALGDTGKAFEYFTKLRNEGLELDVFTYEALLKACCKSGRMQSALAVTREMSAQNIPRNTFVYNILIDGYELLSITHEFVF